MSKFHFFTEIDLISSQVANYAFGPAQGNEETEYRTTSIHTSSGACSAYAVCDGSILIQEDTNDPTYVNIILKPKNQGDVSFLSVKYFIYRRILKDSLIDSSDPNKVAPSVPGHVTEAIWNTQAALNQSIDSANGTTGTNDEPSSKCLGISFSLNGADSKPDTDLIDSIFYDQAFDFKAPVVTAGMKIGDFDFNIYGFEIMVQSLGFNPTLGLVRNNENKITASVLPGGPTQLEIIQNNSDREKILNYIDPCAFYGLHFNTKITVHDSAGGTATKAGNQIYDDVLSKFHNSDVVYLDIRNENGYSFNYYDNYGDDLNASFDPVASGLTTTGYSTNGWPIKILRNSDFASGNTSKKNILRLSFPEGDNTIPLLYIAHGHTYTKYPRTPKNKNKFIALNFTSGFTDEIQIASPNRDGLAATTSSCWYVKVYYIKRNDAGASPGTTLVVPTKHHFDNLFSPVASLTFWDNSDGIKYVSGLHEKFLDAEETLGFAGMVETGIAIEQSRVIHFAYPTDVFISQVKRQNVFKRIQGGSSDKESFFDVIKNIFPKLKLTKKKLQLAPDKYYLRYNEEDIENVKENFWGMCLTSNEHQDLGSAIGSSQLDLNLHTPFILTKTSAVNSDTANNSFYETEHALVGITSFGVKDESSAIFTAYSGDGVINSSNDASTIENIPVTVGTDEFKFDTDNWGKVVARLSVYNQTKLWNLVDINGNPIQYNGGETDYFGNSISGQIQLPAGTRVILFQLHDIKINNAQINHRRIVCWYRNNFREGYVDSRALLNSQNNFINVEDGLINDDLLIEAFINDAKFEVMLTKFLRQSDASPEYEILLNLTENKLDQFITMCNTTDLFILNPIISQLRSLSTNNGLNTDIYNIPGTLQSFYAVQPLIDILDRNNYVDISFTINWSGGSGEFGFNQAITLFCQSNCEYLLNDITVTDEASGHSYKDTTDTEVYPKLKSDLKKISDFLNSLSLVDPLVNSPEGQWLLSNDIQNYLDQNTNGIDTIVIIDSGTWKDRSQNSLWAGYIPIDQSFGFIMSNRVFSVLIHEYNVASVKIIRMRGEDSHARLAVPLQTPVIYWPEYIWNYVCQNGFHSFYTSIQPDPLLGNYVSEDAIKLRDFFQRSSAIGIIYLKKYLDYFVP